MNALTLTAFPFISGPAKQRIINGIRYICLFLFVYTAYAKIIDHDRFLHGLTKVHLVSRNAGLIAVLVPVIEVAVSALLIVPKTLKAGLWTFIVTMAAFTIYIIGAMVWEPRLPCHCGGAIEKLSWSQHIWFNLAFILLASMALRLSGSIKQFKN